MSERPWPTTAKDTIPVFSSMDVEEGGNRTTDLRLSETDFAFKQTMGEFTANLALCQTSFQLTAQHHATDV